jgi:precorrin-6Y C5,15-methyltransferase (decarboxylating)
MADRVTVIGCDGTPFEESARAALTAATLVAGARHHLELPGVPAHAERVVLGSIDLAARRIAQHRGSAVVLADGDPGFFGVVRALRSPEHGLEVEVVPGVSAVARAFARAGMPWDDARVVVAHARTLRRAVNVCRAHPKVAVLTAPGAGPAELALLLGGVHRTFVICEALGTGQEQVTVLTSDRAADHIWRDPNIVLVVGGTVGEAGAAPSGTAASGARGGGWIAGYDPAFPSGPRGWTDPDTPPADPASSAAPAGAAAPERAPVRALELARLGPRPGDLVWDVGAGGGEFAVAAARAGAAVIAVDRDPAACAAATARARRAGIQLQVVNGTAPQALEDLPEPDVVRVGAGGAPVVAACAARRPERITVTAVTRDDAEAIGRALDEAGYTVDRTLLQAVDLAPDWTENQRHVIFALCGHRV